ncbi:MAG TPA: hypothetical protein DCS93_08585 [Microscillaceae bacterium]|nr:hypothetical protein [Microscillaceae bacterium]
MVKNFLYLLLGFMCLPLLTQAQLVRVNSFGSNPGNLAMYRYVPSGITGNAPVVVALHGCTQDAATYANESGWNTLADQYKFYVVYAEQNSGNNSSRCFNWFETGDINRGQGEARSIKSMVDYMKSNYSVDNAQVYVTGFSAGGAMTTVMLAAYPDVFSGGAINAGVAYKAATSLTNAFSAMNGNVNKTPQQWGNLVRGQLSSFSGTYPKVAVFHGTSDFIVRNQNLGEIVEQWTNMHGAGPNPNLTNSSFNGNANITQKKYNNSNGETVVVSYDINGMGHAIAVDPGTGATQGGQTGAYANDQNFYSSYWAAEFWGITNTSGGGTAPAAPSGLTASPNSSSEISLSWTDNANNETGYVVERSTSAGSGFVQVATLGANANSYTDNGLSASTIYYYRVKATNAQGSSPYSNEANATTQASSGGDEVPDTPSGLGTSSGSSSEINLTWTDNANNETSYVVERSTTSGSGFATIATLGANITSYADNGLAASTTYYYRVKASNGVGDSGYSNEANATTGAASGGGPPYTIAQTSGNFYITTLNNTNMGQSFTVPQSGVITKITAKFRNAIANSTLNIFAGNTVSGTPIYSQSGVSAASGVQGIDLSTPFAVSAGQQYTFQFTNASIAYTFTNAYSGGSYWYGTIQYSVFDAYFVIDITANASSRFTNSSITFAEPTVKVFPNPASTTLKIQGVDQSSAYITIRNAQGQLVKTTKGSSPINISQFSKGTYFVQVASNGSITTHKIFVYK